jgi:hypothetical protein
MIGHPGERELGNVVKSSLRRLVVSLIVMKLAGSAVDLK